MRRGGLNILSFWQYPSDKKSDQVMHLNSLKPLKSAKMRKPFKVKGFPINYPPPPLPPCFLCLISTPSRGGGVRVKNDILAEFETKSAQVETIGGLPGTIQEVKNTFSTYFQTVTFGSRGGMQGVFSLPKQASRRYPYLLDSIGQPPDCLNLRTFGQKVGRNVVLDPYPPLLLGVDIIHGVLGGGGGG